jgi:hypothetical protein
MPRRKSLLTVIRDMVQQEVRAAIQPLLGSVSTAKPDAQMRERNDMRGRTALAGIILGRSRSRGARDVRR